MKIRQVKSIYSAELSALRAQRQALAKKLKEQEEQGMDGGRFDRVELTRQIADLGKEYEKAQKVMEQVMEKETLIHNAYAGKQEAEAMGEAMEDMLKCLETARRISEGAKVPAEDEKKLMEYSQELYMAAKNMAFLRAAQEKRKEYDTLWEEEPEEEPQDPSEIAANTEVDVPLPPKREYSEGE